MHQNQAPEINQSDYLSVLTTVPPARLKPFTESLLPHLGEIEVVTNRTGLVMVPGTDTVQGINFHLGEVLVSEAHVQLTTSDGSTGQGYGACFGRDLEQSLAIAILDAALQARTMSKAIMTFVAAEAHLQAEADHELLRQVESTRVEMETF